MVRERRGQVGSGLWAPNRVPTCLALPWASPLGWKPPPDPSNTDYPSLSLLPFPNSTLSFLQLGEEGGGMALPRVLLLQDRPAMGPELRFS